MSGTSLDSVLSGDVVEQVEQPAQAEQQADTGEVSATPADDQQTEQVEQVEQDDPIEKHRKGLEAGIAAERTKRQTAERELAEARAKLQALEQPRQRQQQAPEQLQRPRRDDFQDQEAYEDALLDYGDKRREAQQEQQRAEREAQDYQARMARTADEVVLKGQQAFEDFDAVINKGLGPYLMQPTQQAQLFRASIMTGERGHEVAYYLAKNPDEAARVYALPDLQMVRAINLIEATKLETVQAEQEPAPKPRIPQTLTQARDARTGQFKPEAYSGPTPLDKILASKR